MATFGHGISHCSSSHQADAFTTDSEDESDDKETELNELQLASHTNKRQESELPSSRISFMCSSKLQHPG